MLQILYKFGENLKTVIPCNLYLAIDGDNQSNWLELRLAKHGGVVPMTKKEVRSLLPVQAHCAEGCCTACGALLRCADA